MASPSRSPRAASTAVALIVSAVLVGCIDGRDDGATGGRQVHEDQVTVLAGRNDDQDPTVVVTEFLPESVTIAAGKAVEWRIAGPEPHSVTFTADGRPPVVGDEALIAPTLPTGPYDGRALVSSGLVPLGPGTPPPFKVTFAVPGTYTYYCVIHPNMTGKVTVVDAGGRTDGQGEVDRRADAELARWLEEGRAAKRKLLETTPAVERAADGTSTYRVQTGVTTEHADVLTFGPADASLNSGDRITFVNNSRSPHTAAFAGRSAVPQDPTSPQVRRPAPGPSPQTLNTNDFFNTGVLLPNVGPPGSAPPETARSFTFVVRAAGSYLFVCLFHAHSGMGGTLKVA